MLHRLRAFVPQRRPTTRGGADLSDARLLHPTRVRPNEQEKAILADLVRELDALDLGSRMVRPYGRVKPYIIEIPYGPHAPVRVVVATRETRNWYDRPHRDFTFEQIADAGLVRAGDVVFDIGSNVGVTTAWYAMAVGPEGSVHAFEPVPWNVAISRATMRLNGLANVTIHPFGLAAEADEHAWRPDGAGGRQAEESGPVLAFQPLSAVAHLAPNFVKIDVEGAEDDLAQADWAALASIRRGVMKFHPNEIAARDVDPRHVLSQFLSAGFALRHSVPDGPIVTGHEDVLEAWHLYLSRPRRLREEIASVTPRRARAGRDDRAILDTLSRELDAIEAKIPMLENNERVDPYILDIAYPGRALRAVVAIRETKSWYDRPHNEFTFAEISRSGLLRPGDRVFDLGCNVGLTTVWAALMVGRSGQVDGFDPFPWNVAVARACAQINGVAERVRIHGVGVGREARTIEVPIVRARTVPIARGQATPEDDEGEREQTMDIRVEALETFAHLRPTYVKIDVEGAEAELSHCDWSQFPDVRSGLLEVHGTDIAERGETVRDVVRRFHAAGFAMRRSRWDGPLVTGDEALVEDWHLYMTRSVQESA